MDRSKGDLKMWCWFQVILYNIFFITIIDFIAPEMYNSTTYYAGMVVGTVWILITNRYEKSKKTDSVLKRFLKWIGRIVVFFLLIWSIGSLLDIIIWGIGCMLE
ncbi:hypothetical protein C7M51_04404 (plasmid) [Mixta intestinalis]|uniref:Uncharacterized protein n=1 Tax=Mixta intestinalis TaxID=1615494 RepID=A0A6P1Q5W1_9GAMM|nr:hypothetical protein C7M51_04404 [Mixta intestinalis]